MPLKIRPKDSYTKIKNLRLITPEYASSLGELGAEAPTLCSPYINLRSYCHVCDTHYSPLVYQVGRTTEAQHFCKENGGGIYVQLATDHTRQWRYNNGLFQATVHPSGPIRMGDDRGFQFRSVTIQRILNTNCFMCAKPITSGVLLTLELQPHNILPICHPCKELHSFPQESTGWSFRITDGQLSFNRKLPAPAYTNYPHILGVQDVS